MILQHPTHIEVIYNDAITERLFSAAKTVVTDKQTCLDCEKINEILFLQKTLETLKQLSNNSITRKLTILISSLTRISSEDSICTARKLTCIDVEDDVDYFNGGECCFDWFVFYIL